MNLEHAIDKAVRSDGSALGYIGRDDTMDTPRDSQEIIAAHFLRYFGTR